MKRLAAVLLVLGAGIALGGCNVNSAGDSDNVYGVQSDNAGIVDFHNGVYYFPYISANFANVLSDFIAKHPELELVAMCGDGTWMYGKDRGYFVVFRKRNR